MVYTEAEILEKVKKTPNKTIPSIDECIVIIVNDHIKSWKKKHYLSQSKAY